MVSQSTVLAMLTFLLISVSPITAQRNNNNDNGGYWKDSYKLGYTYDRSDEQRGPSAWWRVNSDEWGEWQDVNVLLNEDLGLIDWDRQSNMCARTNQPTSPIDIVPTQNSCTDRVEMRVRQFNPQADCHHPVDSSSTGEDNHMNANAWELTPYSLRWYMPRTDRACVRPTLRLDNFGSNADRRSDEHFVLLWVELHARSEHVVDGRRYDAELQMVHMGTTRSNELVIVSVLIEADGERDHADFQTYLLDGWQQKAREEEATCAQKKKLLRQRRHLTGGASSANSYLAALSDYQRAEQSPVHYYNASDAKERELQGNRWDCQPDKYGGGCEDFGLGPRRRMFPYNLWPSVWYYSYQGSLTAPPCAGTVNWRVIDTPLYVSSLLCVIAFCFDFFI